MIIPHIHQGYFLGATGLERVFYNMCPSGGFWKRRTFNGGYRIPTKRVPKIWTVLLIW